jgi:hypothetical protein
MRLTILIAFLAATVDGQVTACSFPPPGLANESRAKFTDLYENGADQYSVRIPKGLAGYDLAGPGLPQHGFGLILGARPQGYVVVWSEANSFFSESPADEAIRLLINLREGRANIESATITQSHLGNLSAVRLVVRYTCPGLKDRYVQDSTIALTGRVYEVTLYSRAERYNRDAAVLAEVLKSWKHPSQDPEKTPR